MDNARKDTVWSGMLKKINKDGAVKTPELGNCWEIDGCQNNGYRMYANKLAHRLSYEIHYGEIPNNYVVRHKCDNRSCVNPAHLETGTKQQNRDDMTRSGTVVAITKRGINNGNSTLTDAQVEEIRAMPKENQRDIAKLYGVSQAHIWRIQSGEARITTHEVEDEKAEFFKRTVERKVVMNESLGECWMTKYGRQSCSYKNKKMHAYKAAYLYEHGSIPDGMWLLHSCDEESCINPAHLRVGTMQENHNDVKERGRLAQGDSHGMAKLSKDDVIKIYTNSDNKSNRYWALLFKVSDGTISNIMKGKNWTHVTKSIVKSPFTQTSPAS